MNKWELKRKYTLDCIKEMVNFAESINKNHESEEYKLALWTWVQDYLDEYRITWEKQFGILEDIDDRRRISNNEEVHG